MRILITLIGLLIIPSVCFAHSGTVARAVASYLPFFLPFLSGIILACYRFIKRYLDSLYRRRFIGKK
jgi:hypothetical protein